MVAPRRRQRAPVAEAESERDRIRAKFKILPLDYMMQILNDEGATREDRMWAAQYAAPYIHVKLTSTDVKIEGPIVHEVNFRIVE